MPEGLDPIEAGRKLHEHREKQHEQAAEGEGHGKPEGRHSRIVQISEALLLALVTIAAAWAGYSAARWGTASRVQIAQSSTLRNLATRADLEALTTPTSPPPRSKPGSPPTRWATSRRKRSPSAGSGPRSGSRST